MLLGGAETLKRRELGTRSGGGAPSSSSQATNMAVFSLKRSLPVADGHPKIDERQTTSSIRVVVNYSESRCSPCRRPYSR
jgi:hypothetical protein